MIGLSSAMVEFILLTDYNESKKRIAVGKGDRYEKDAVATAYALRIA